MSIRKVTLSYDFCGGPPLAAHLPFANHMQRNCEFRPMGLTKTRTILLVLALSMVAAWAAEAACPYGTRYMCKPTFSGKMQCGCY